MPALADLSRRVRGRLPQRAIDGLFEAQVRATTVAAARGVTAPLAFGLNELLLRRRVRAYQLRGSGRTLYLRHPVFDAWAVHEVSNSRVYDLPGSVREALEGVERPRIVDVGAHIGTATLLLLDRCPNAHVLALEPQPETASLLRRTIAANGLDGQCEVLEAAAGVAAGTATMDGFSLLAHFVRDGTPEAVDLLPPLAKYEAGRARRTQVQVVDVLPLLADAHVVKMDIEGGEWPILQDPRFASLGITGLVLEYHPQGSPEPDPLVAVRRLLGDAGFSVEDPVEQYGPVGVVWAWRGKRAG